LGQTDDAGAMGLSQLVGAIRAAVGNGDAFRVLRDEVRGAQLDHFTGTNKQYMALAEVAKNSAGQFYGGRSH